MSKPLHEETIQERDTRHAAEIAAASAPKLTPEQTRAANVEQEKACQEVDDFERLEESGADRYEPTVEHRAAMHATITQIHGGKYTVANLAAALDYCIQHKLITPKKKAIPGPNDPKTHAQWAVQLGYSFNKIRNHTSAARIRELRKNSFHREVIDWVIANQFEPKENY